MNPDARKYLETELEHLQKAYELQFTHFMGVFYFWTVVVTAPATAGLLTSGSNTNQTNLPILLLLVALMGWFLSAKMFDIRCSQLRYIININQVRQHLYDDLKAHLPKKYQISFSADTNLQRTAFSDFGMIMAFTMSAIDAAFLGFAVPPLQGYMGFNWNYFWLYLLFGIDTYLTLVILRVPKPPSKRAK